MLFVSLLSACSPLGTAAGVGELATSTPTPGKVADTISDLVGETEIASQTFLGFAVEDWFNLLLALLLATLDLLMTEKGFYYALYMSQFKCRAPAGAEAAAVDSEHVGFWGWGSDCPTPHSVSRDVGDE